MNREEKLEQYTLKIVTALATVLNEDGENHIADLAEDDNGTLFFHALANVAPTLVYNDLTSSGLDILKFNHLANLLIFRFGNKEE